MKIQQSISVRLQANRQISLFLATKRKMRIFTNAKEKTTIIERHFSARYGQNIISGSKYRNEVRTKWKNTNQRSDDEIKSSRREVWEQELRHIVIKFSLDTTIPRLALVTGSISKRHFRRTAPCFEVLLGFEQWGTEVEEAETERERVFDRVFNRNLTDWIKTCATYK